MDGRLYLQTVETRSWGPFPYPEAMRHGVFSVTKTLALGLSMLHLAERYGESLFQERIAEHVPELASHSGWRGVTFETSAPWSRPSRPTAARAPETDTHGGHQPA